MNLKDLSICDLKVLETELTEKYFRANTGYIKDLDSEEMVNLEKQILSMRDELNLRMKNLLNDGE